MGWFQPGNIHKEKKEGQSSFAPQEERVYRFFLKPGNSNEIIFLDDFTDEDNYGNKTAPYGFFYEHTYQKMKQDEKGNYTIKDGFRQMATCRKWHDDKKGCPMCDAKFQATKSAFLTTLVKRVSQAGNEYFARQLYIVKGGKGGNWEGLKFAMNDGKDKDGKEKTENLQYHMLGVKRGDDPMSVTGGEFFTKIEKLSKDQLIEWKTSDPVKVYGEITPFDYGKILEPMTYDEMKEGVDSEKFKLIWKQKDKDETNETENHLSIDDKKSKDDIPF